MFHYLHIRYNINLTLVFFACIYFPTVNKHSAVIAFWLETDSVSTAK